MGKTTGQQFMEMTKYQHQGLSEQEQGLPQPPLVSEYSGPGPLIDLPDPAGLNLGRVDLIEVINRRNTLRKYSENPLSMDELSFLLWATQGVKESTNRPVTLRTVPSAGARHAFETLVLANRVEGLEPGLYHFLAVEHRVGLLSGEPDLGERISQACLKQEKIHHSAATIIWVVELARMRWRYDQRGYRYLHLDAGHVCQNLYLAAEAIGCGVCAIGAFDDDLLNPLLGLDGEDRFVIYMGSLGKRG